ncbi:MAG TPA: imidazolonepropionase, partial [Burkholderiaceae bacterium]|nr:imidazolonepropionase [Burkholderiaceae bacterium]
MTASPVTTTLWRHAQLATMAPGSPWGWVPDGALLVQGDSLLWVGPERDLPPDLARLAQREESLGGALVTPGLIDCHTHLVYGGHRAHEFELRLQGASYDEIARAGGGIRSTVAATRAASDEQLYALAAQRARTLLAEGVTTLEVKSGYGLSAEHEARCLR